MANSNETRSLLPPGAEMIWNALPLCRCAGAGVMPVIGWHGRTIICSCEAGKFVAENHKRLGVRLAGF